MVSCGSRGRAAGRTGTRQSTVRCAANAGAQEVAHSRCWPANTPGGQTQPVLPSIPQCVPARHLSHSAHGARPMAAASRARLRHPDPTHQRAHAPAASPRLEHFHPVLAGPLGQPLRQPKQQAPSDSEQARRDVTSSGETACHMQAYCPDKPAWHTRRSAPCIVPSQHDSRRGRHRPRGIASRGSTRRPLAAR